MSVIKQNYPTNPRQLTLLCLREIEKGAYAEIALERVSSQGNLSLRDRGLLTELVYGIVRRKRSLDQLINQFAKKSSDRQPPDLRLILQIGLYQLRYVNHIPPSAAVNTTVDLAKINNLSGLTGVINGILRQYLRQRENTEEVLQLPDNLTQKIAIKHSFPDWLIDHWLTVLGAEETELLATAYNQSPTIHLRVNPLKTTLEQVKLALIDRGLTVTELPYVSHGLKLGGTVGKITELPGYDQGWWTVQDSSAQLVTYLLDPQPDEVIIDSCAAPGGKTTHMAELMGDRGVIWAIDRTSSRLKKLAQNQQRLDLKSINRIVGDSRELHRFNNYADRVLLDAPCSGLGTLHRRADARWQKTPDTIQELAKLQGELLENNAQWVKPGGILVYATCTIHPLENEGVILPFLDTHPQWEIVPPIGDRFRDLVSDQGWIKVWLHRHQMDGFFMVKLRKKLADKENGNGRSDRPAIGL
jgi:16S rRNA (cytosine967-C5)-methyltransferase